MSDDPNNPEENEENQNPEEQTPEGTEEGAVEGAAEGEGGASEDEALADEWAAAMEESGDAEEGESEDGNVQQAPLDNLTDEAGKGDGKTPELEVILDIPVSISMEVGRTQIPIRNLLQLNQGSVVELDRLAGEPLDVLVNGTLIAHGEVVMVNDKFGIRLTDVISQTERITD